MKATGKIFLLLFIIAVIVFGAWKVLDSTLFADEETITPVTSSIGAPAPLSPVTEPSSLSEDEAFEITSADTDPASENIRLFCKVADDTLSKLYDLRLADKPYEQATRFLQEDSTIPAEYVNLFTTLARTLWSSPKEQLKPKDAITQQFSEQCLNIDRNP